jgi:outer membrane receptor for ferric coprogen and ferric-rhodotorulic acid
MLELPLLLLALTAADSEVADSAARDEIVVTGTVDDTSAPGDYAARATRAATRLALSPRETPQSVSIVTRAQIDDFALRDVNAVLATTTGINVQQVETDRTYYSARGFDITNFQIDGVGQPFTYGLQNGSLDTATYDRVEVLRGANGLLSATGNPSATINFVRKRPGKQLAASASLLYGSFDQVRVDGDISAPLTRDGSVRARVVGAYQDSDSYLDRYHSRRGILYGIVEADIGPATTVSAGYQYQKHLTSGGLWGALPLYDANGNPTHYARSTSTSAAWSRWAIEDQQIFGDLTHDFGGGWSGKASVLRHMIDEDDRLFYVYGNPDPATGDGLFSYPGAFRGPTRELTLDAYISGPVSLFGRTHELVFGLNRGTSHHTEYSSYPAGIGTPLPGTSAFDGNYAYPAFPDFTLSADFRTRRDSAYGLARINPADGIKLMVGANVTHVKGDGISYGVAQDYALTRALPFVGVTADLGPAISAYASFATIFNPQSEIDASLKVLPPIEGDSIEGGLKGEWFGGRLNASAAIFRVRQRNTAEAAGFDLSAGKTIYTTVDATSKGIEFDIAGTIAPGLQLSGGYTLLRIEGPDGEKVRTYVPRHTARLNATYSPAAIPKLKLGAAVQYQSGIRRVQNAVTTTGTTVISRQPAYALVDLMASYQLARAWSIALNLRNVTNHKYLTSLYWDQAYYGPPRAATVTLGWRY